MDDLRRKFEQWDPKTQAEVAALVKEMSEDPPKVWFCKRGRACDGRPHDGVPYPHARPDQWPPTVPFFVWLVMSGRGAGKTRTGSEWTRRRSRKFARMGIIGRRITDIRQTLVEGESGLIRICERAKIPYDWKPSKREFTFEDTGSKAFFYSGEEPDSLRGPEHDTLWLDEPAHMPAIQEVWDNALLGLRLGMDPKILCTTTPVPTEWVKELIKRDDVVLTRVSTYANLENLTPTYRQTVIARYEGTRLGRQELHGEVIEDVEGALWNAEIIDLAKQMPAAFEQADILTEMPWERIVVGVDPAGTANKKSDLTGIIVVAKMKGLYYVLDDATGRYSPDQWAKKTAVMFHKWHADRVIVERNYGGDLVEKNLRTQEEMLPIKTVHSRRGKEIRAEPIVGLYEQGKVKHPTPLDDLEDEEMTWVPGEGDSPNRVDALVHAMTELMGKGGVSSVASAVGRQLTPGGTTVR